MRESIGLNADIIPEPDVYTNPDLHCLNMYH